MTVMVIVLVKKVCLYLHIFRHESLLSIGLNLKRPSPRSDLVHHMTIDLENRHNVKLYIIVPFETSKMNLHTFCKEFMFLYRQLSIS